MKYLVSMLLSMILTGVVVASEMTEQNVGQAADSRSTLETENDCCWDKVDFDRTVVPYQPASGPDCCWVPVWGEISK